MNFSRRAIFLAALVAPFLLMGRRALAALIGAQDAASSPEQVVTSLRVWFDTLLPTDGATPSASALGVHLAIAEAARDDGKQTKLLDDGVRWLDIAASNRHGARFHELQPEARETIVRVAQDSPAGSLPRVFFFRTLNDAYLYYYSHPLSWAPLGYEGPPQPTGFPDFAGPPGKTQNDR